MRITKAQAKQIAEQMVKPAFDKAAALKQVYKELVIEEYKAKIPKKIVDAFADKHLSPYIRRTDCIDVDGIEMSGHYTERRVYIGDVLPSYSSSTPGLVLTQKQQNIAEAYDASVDALKEAKLLQQEIEQTLNNLRTYPNIEKDLPEAVQYLPKTIVSTALVVNTDPLRAKLAELQKQSTPTA